MNQRTGWPSRYEEARFLVQLEQEMTMTSPDIPDYSDFKEESPIAGDNLMKSLMALADEQEAAEAEVDRLNALMDEAKANLKRISEHEIPKLLDGMEGKISLPDGRSITLNEKIRTSVSGERKERAFDWIEKQGFGSIIKRRINIDIGKDQEALSDEIKGKLAEIDSAVIYKEERNVPWQTMDAFVKEKLGQGADVPLELFGVYHQRTTKIKR
ncbi:MAG: hypothetical protein Tp138OMZ00d2C19078261_54 [Prokaryotic dsDNA virus sp.]|jgi:hypothetical protein|nr:MAG: hypothetical protein Tp138OMZ00d2C19078261_54 [Prokaryotic dsDNA virus sp.]|tara:strand:- start:1037 stop:1675 length:639 start_codon:yes stop_codon:yes gene_type:complete